MQRHVVATGKAQVSRSKRRTLKHGLRVSLRLTARLPAVAAGTIWIIKVAVRDKVTPSKVQRPDLIPEEKCGRAFAVGGTLALVWNATHQVNACIFVALRKLLSFCRP